MLRGPIALLGNRRWGVAVDQYRGISIDRACLRRTAPTSLEYLIVTGALSNWRPVTDLTLHLLDCRECALVFMNVEISPINQDGEGVRGATQG